MADLPVNLYCEGDLVLNAFATVAVGDERYRFFQLGVLRDTVVELILQHLDKFFICHFSFLC